MAKISGQTELHMAAGHESFNDSRIESVARLINEGAATHPTDQKRLDKVVQEIARRELAKIK